MLKNLMLALTFNSLYHGKAVNVVLMPFHFLSPKLVEVAFHFLAPKLVEDPFTPCWKSYHCQCCNVIFQEQSSYIYMTSI